MLQPILNWVSPPPPPARNLASEEEDWVVIGEEGCAVRERENLTSRFVGAVDTGCTVQVSEARGNRLKISAPIKGWVSIVSEASIVILRKAEPDGLCCPITKVMFRDPVLVPHSGYSYERQALSHFWKKTKGGTRDQGWPRDPMTNVQLPDTAVHPNIAIRLLIESWLGVNPTLIPEGWSDRQLPPIQPCLGSPPTQGGRFGGYCLGQRICAAHAVRGLRKGDPGVQKGDVGVFKGPIKPYDRAVAEGLAEVVWDSSPSYSFTIPLKVIAPMDKHCGILKKILVEQKQNGITDVELEEKVAKLADATVERDRVLERVTMSTVEKHGQHKGWVSEVRVCETVLKLMEGPHLHSMQESVLGPLQMESVQRTIKKLSKTGILDRSTATVQEAFPFRARLLRISAAHRFTSMSAATAAALLILATLEEVEN